MKFQRYEKYKASGIDWLGEIPEEWEENHLKRNCKKITDGSHTSPDTSSDDYPFLSTVDLNNGKLDFTSCLYTSKNDYLALVRNGCKPIKNDVLFSKDGTIGETTYLKENIDFVVGSSLVIIRAKLKIFSPNFLLYCLGSYLINAQARGYVKGSGLPRISIFNVAKLFVPIPPLQTQTTIANYLDQHTALIDKKIELLKAKKQNYIQLKQTLINEVVSKGLDKTAEMKNSGIEWIGQIPKHWEVKRLKDCVGKIKGKNLDTIEKEEFGYLPNLSLEYLRRDRSFFTTYVKSNDPQMLVSDDDLIIIWDGAGVGEILKGKYGYLSSTIAKLTFKKRIIEQSYFYNFRFILDDILKSIPSGMGIPHLNPLVFDTFKIPIPPKPEQIAIAKYLDEKTSKIDQIIKKIDENILALQEFRKTLINDVVTGKVKVL